VLVVEEMTANLKLITSTVAERSLTLFTVSLFTVGLAAVDRGLVVGYRCHHEKVGVLGKRSGSVRKGFITGQGTKSSAPYNSHSDQSRCTGYLLTLTSHVPSFFSLPQSFSTLQIPSLLKESPSNKEPLLT